MIVPANDFVPRAAEPNREDVQIGNRSSRSPAVCLEDGVLDHGEVAIDVKIGLNERDGGVHPITSQADLSDAADARHRGSEPRSSRATNGSLARPS